MRGFPSTSCSVWLEPPRGSLPCPTWTGYRLVKTMHILLREEGGVNEGSGKSSRLSTYFVKRADRGAILLLPPVVKRGCLRLVSIRFLKVEK